MEKLIKFAEDTCTYNTSVWYASRPILINSTKFQEGTSSLIDYFHYIPPSVVIGFARFSRFYRSMRIAIYEQSTIICLIKREITMISHRVAVMSDKRREFNGGRVYPEMKIDLGEINLDQQPNASLYRLLLAKSSWTHSNSESASVDRQLLAIFLKSVMSHSYEVRLSLLFFLY